MEIIEEAYRDYAPLLTHLQNRHQWPQSVQQVSAFQWLENEHAHHHATCELDHEHRTLRLIER